MKYKCKDITACGKRIKYEARKRRLTNEDMRELLCFANVKSVSAVYSGTTISDSVIDILSKTWNLRKEYLLCDDDYETWQDKQNALLTNNQLDYTCVINYLKSLGYEFEINIYWICTPAALHDKYKIFDSYISQNDREYFNYCISNMDSDDDISRLLFKLVNLSVEDFIKENAEYIDFLDYEDYVPFDNMLFNGTKNNNQALFNNGILFDDSLENNRIQMMYDLKKDGKHVEYITLEYAKTFFMNLDNICKSSVEVMLSYNHVAMRSMDMLQPRDNSHLDLYKKLDNIVKCTNDDLPFK